MAYLSYCWHATTPEDEAAAAEAFAFAVDKAAAAPDVSGVPSDDVDGDDGDHVPVYESRDGALHIVEHKACFARSFRKGLARRTGPRFGVDLRMSWSHRSCFTLRDGVEQV